MKSAQLELNGKPVKEIILVVNPTEARMIHEAVLLYASMNKRKTSIKKLLTDLESCNIFF